MAEINKQMLRAIIMDVMNEMGAFKTVEETGNAAFEEESTQQGNEVQANAQTVVNITNTVAPPLSCQPATQEPSLKDLIRQMLMDMQNS